MQSTRGGVEPARALVAEASARFLPLALGAPEIPLVHTVHFAALLVIGARPPTRAAGRATTATTRALCKTHVLLKKINLLWISLYHTHWLN